MTHPDRDGQIFVTDNYFSGQGHWQEINSYEDKENIFGYCPKCKKKREFEYEPNPADRRFHCIICDTAIDMRKKNKYRKGQGKNDR